MTTALAYCPRTIPQAFLSALVAALVFAAGFGALQLAGAVAPAVVDALQTVTEQGGCAAGTWAVDHDACLDTSRFRDFRPAHH